MPQYFRAFRIFFLIVCFICLTIYMVIYTPWHEWFGGPRDYSPVMAEGDALVAAIETYKSEHGLWPEYLEDATPRGWNGKLTWYYELSPMREADARPTGGAAGGTGVPGGGVRQIRLMPSLATHVEGDRPRAHVGYDFDPVAPRWRLFGDGADSVLRRGAPAEAIPATLPAAQLLEKQLAELDRRIARDHGMIDAWRMKAALLVAGGREPEARQVIAAAGEALPESFWPGLARAAALDVGALGEKANGRWPESAEAYAVWTQVHLSMTHAYYLSVLQRRAGKMDAALLTIQTALAQPMEVAGDDDQVAAYYLWDMASFALRQEKWDLVIDLAKVWQQAQSDGRVKDASFLALRAAARLARGEVAEAKSDLESLQGMGNVWARSVELLRAAVERGDRAFRYDPGNFPESYAVFEVQE